jgi:hypothetical protein
MLSAASRLDEENRSKRRFLRSGGTLRANLTFSLVQNTKFERISCNCLGFGNLSLSQFDSRLNRF